MKSYAMIDKGSKYLKKMNPGWVFKELVSKRESQ